MVWTAPGQVFDQRGPGEGTEIEQ